MIVGYDVAFILINWSHLVFVIFCACCWHNTVLLILSGTLLFRVFVCVHVRYPARCGWILIFAVNGSDMG